MRRTVFSSMPSVFTKIKRLLRKSSAQQQDVEAQEEQRQPLQQTQESLIDSSDPEVYDDESRLGGTETEVEENGDSEGRGGKKGEKQKKVGFFQLFRYSTKTEKILLVIAAICSVVHGALLPVFTIVSWPISGYDSWVFI